LTKSDFYIELENKLLFSTAEIRNNWARIICEQDIELSYLSKLLYCERKIATRFLLLLSDVGQVNPEKLHQYLPTLLEMRGQIKHANIDASFPGFWLIAGVPEQNESKAIELLFEWLQSPKTTVTSKSRSMFVLLKLTNKYPELKNELKLCLEDQMNKHTKSFSKRVEKLISKLLIL